MATFTHLQDQDIAAIGAGFGLGPVTRWAAIDAGTVNSNFDLETATGRFCVRINEGKSETLVRYEADLVEALARGGVPTPMPLRTPAGDPCILFQERWVSAFPWVSGGHREAGQVTASDAAAVGRALGRLHATGLTVAERFAWPGIYTFEHICARAAALRERRDPVLAPALAAVSDETAWLVERAAVRAAVPRGIIHGDLFRDNVLFDGPTLTALIDFEQASTGSLCYDLAVSLNAWCYGDDFDPALVRALVRGYREVRELDAAERAALPVEVRAAAMRFTVTRMTDVYLAGVDKPTKDFRRYLRRLERWREIGAAGLLEWTGLGE